MLPENSETPAQALWVNDTRTCVSLEHAGTQVEHVTVK